MLRCVKNMVLVILLGWACLLGTANGAYAVTCGELGYNVTDKSQCPGRYFTCPFDADCVRCDHVATVGDIKYSSQTVDHDGWLRCNGRTEKDVEMTQGLIDILKYRGFKTTDVLFAPGNDIGLSGAEIAQLPNISSRDIYNCDMEGEENAFIFNGYPED